MITHPRIETVRFCIAKASSVIISTGLSFAEAVIAKLVLSKFTSFSTLCGANVIVPTRLSVVIVDPIRIHRSPYIVSFRTLE